MADYTHYKEHVFSLDLPTNWVEISKVLNACEQQGSKYDDDVIVTGEWSEDDSNGKLLFRMRDKS